MGHDTQPTERRKPARDTGGHLLRPAYVSTVGEDVPVEFFDSFGRRGELILGAHRISDPRHRSARIEQHDVGPLLREPNSVRPPLPVGPTGDERDLALETVHVGTPWRLLPRTCRSRRYVTVVSIRNAI